MFTPPSTLPPMAVVVRAPSPFDESTKLWSVLVVLLVVAAFDRLLPPMVCPHYKLSEREAFPLINSF
jgi:hypothetical protein